MKKKDFITLILSVVGGLLFSLGMCMALVPEMGTITQGVVLGVIGMAVLFAMVLVRRKMDGKPAIVFNGRVIGITLYSIFSTAVFGAGMCMVLVASQMMWGIIVGVVGIVLLLGLIPICKGLK
ncbi:MAG: hypothetical protein HDR26_06715 [Lachnospiraceae bacterium]|nr:hypothetical protein [Lachnospiraceae bacterium]